MEGTDGEGLDDLVRVRGLRAVIHIAHPIRLPVQVVVRLIDIDEDRGHRRTAAVVDENRIINIRPRGADFVIHLSVRPFGVGAVAVHIRIGKHLSGDDDSAEKDCDDGDGIGANPHRPS